MSEELVASLEQYLPQLIRLADRNISERLQGKVEAEDIAASVCRTFIRRYREDDFHIDSEPELWKLLVTITLNKTRNKARHFSAARRDVSREHGLDGAGLVVAMQTPPSPEEALQFLETIAILEEGLDDIGIQVLQLLLEGESQVAIAKRLNISTRTVSRKLVAIRKELGETASGSG